MEATSSTVLSDEEKRALLLQILADQDGRHSSDWREVFMQVVSGSESDPTFKTRMLFALMSDGCVFWKDVVCQILLHRPNTPASEIFPALRMFDKLQDCTKNNIVCSVKAVAALLHRKIQEITVSNKGDVRDALREINAIDFSQMSCW
jgi:hypothetical protein